MGAFNKVTKESLDNVQINAGMILASFNPSSVTAPEADDIVCATTGGIQVDCTPTFEDFGADIDNCPNNTKELKKVTGWECKFTFTAVEVTEKTIALALGAAGSVSNEVQPQNELIGANFNTIWFVSERVDNKIIAIELKNGLGGGLSYKTQKNAKGQLSITLTGHISMADSDEVPMTFYVCQNTRSASGMQVMSLTGTSSMSDTVTPKNGTTNTTTSTTSTTKS